MARKQLRLGVLVVIGLLIACLVVQLFLPLIYEKKLASSLDLGDNLRVNISAFPALKLAAGNMDSYTLTYEEQGRRVDLFWQDINLQDLSKNLPAQQVTVKIDLGKMRSAGLWQGLDLRYKKEQVQLAGDLQLWGSTYSLTGSGKFVIADNTLKLQMDTFDLRGAGVTEAMSAKVKNGFTLPLLPAGLEQKWQWGELTQNNGILNVKGVAVGES